MMPSEDKSRMTIKSENLCTLSLLKLFKYANFVHRINCNEIAKKSLIGIEFSSES